MPTAITHDPVFTTPVSSTNTAVVRWSGTAGAVLQDSGVLIDGSNNITGIGTIGSGAITSTGGITGTQVDILAQGDLRLQDTTGGQYVALQAAGTTTSHTLTLPATQGSANTVLQNNGSGALSWAAAGGANLVYLGTAVASSSSSVSVTWSDDSEYVQFLALGNEFRVSSQYAGLGLQLGDSSGIDTGSGDYSFVTGNDSAGSSTSSVSVAESSNRIAMGVRGINNSSGYPCSFALWVSRGGSTYYNQVTGTHSYREHTGVLAGGTVLGRRNAAITVTGIAVVPNTGNMPTGRLTVWGVKHE